MQCQQSLHVGKSLKKNWRQLILLLKKTSFILDESVCFLIKYHCSYSQLKSQHNHDHKSPTILAYIPDQSKFRMTQFQKMPIISTGLLLPRLSQVILEKSYINLLRLMKMRFLFLKVQAERLKLTTSPLDLQYFFGYQILETHSYANARHSKANSGLARQRSDWNFLMFYEQ